MIATAWTVAGVMAALAMLHAYWALGGRAGSAVAIPQSGGRPLFRPGRGGTLAVAVGLLGAALAALDAPYPLFQWLPHEQRAGARFALGLLFLARAVGDFRHVGFFKRRREGAFASWDSRLFSPLSLALGLAFLLLGTQPPG
jgi:hypothetical protein